MILQEKKKTIENELKKISEFGKMLETIIENKNCRSSNEIN